MNLIVNGSFEKAAKGFSAPTGNGEQLANGSTAIAGWTVFGGLAGDGVAWLPNGDTYGVSTPYGSDFLDLTGYHDGQPYFGVEQTIKTVVGAKYDLTFHLGVDNNSSIYDGPIGVTATAGATSHNFTSYDPKKPGNVWRAFSLTFTATATSTVISIQGLAGDQYIGLDNVAVQPVTAASAAGGSASGFASAMAALDTGAGGAVHPADIAPARAPALVRPHAMTA
jgi:hypothetical protein